MKRIEAICSLIPRCEVFADIGCDHGYISQFVLQNELADRVICSDISPKCLEKAKNLLFDYQNVEFVCTNGLEGINCDVAVIAGLGGRVIISILTNNLDGRQYILQPQDHAKELRLFLTQNGYSIAKDFVVKENDKYYDVMLVQKGREQLDEIQLELGAFCYEGSELLRERITMLYAKFSSYKDGGKNSQKRELLKAALNTLKTKKESKMAKINDILNIVRAFANEDATLVGYNDNVGLLLGRADGATSKVICCLDATIEVIREAVEVGAKLVISHHPFIYTPVSRITDDTPLGEKILCAAENKIAVYSAHTNLDLAACGINDYVAQLIELEDITPLDESLGASGLGRIGNLKKPMSARALAGRVKKQFDCNVRIVASEEALISRVAIINGGGGAEQYITKARQMGADCYITSDIKYHAALRAKELGLALIEPTHYAMEKVFIKNFVSILNIMAEDALDVEFVESKVEKSPYID